jgi:hypothetical protein
MVKGAVLASSRHYPAIFLEGQENRGKFGDIKLCIVVDSNKKFIASIFMAHFCLCYEDPDTRLLRDFDKHPSD